jgi:hypothetical protein
MKALLGTLLLIPFLLWGGIRIYKGVVFDIGCSGHLKRAADANTVELASKELDQAIQYLERNNITTGYTSILYQTPSEDVGFFYANVKSSRAELSLVTDATAQLEKSNLLIKLRETLLDQGEKGTDVTEPSGISVFPNNGGWMLFGVVSSLIAIVGVILIFIMLAEW